MDIPLTNVLSGLLYLDKSWTQTLQGGVTNMSKKMMALAAAVMLLVPGCVAAQMKPAKDIVGVAVEAGSFKTLVTAVTAADLVATLQGTGPFTVFAPSDAAFAKLPKATLDALLKDKKALAAVLTYHVVSGKVMAKDIVAKGSMKATTVNGEAVDVQVRAGKVYINGAQVVTADVGASNGVIHVIDTVLLPPKK